MAKNMSVETPGNFFVAPQPQFDGDFSSREGLDRSRQQFIAAAGDTEHGLKLERRLVADNIAFPSDLQSAKYRADRLSGKHRSWTQWLGYEASDDQLASALAWNQEATYISAQDGEWYDKLDGRVQKVREWLDRRAQDDQSFQQMATIFAQEGARPRIVIGAPLDLNMATSWGYTLQRGRGSDKIRVMRRVHPEQIVCHEILHGLGGLANTALNEGAAQSLTAQFMAEDPGLVAATDALRFGQTRRTLHPLEHDALPENLYFHGQLAIQALGTCITRRTDDQNFPIQRYFVGYNREENQSELQHVAHAATGHNIIRWAHDVYLETFLSTHDKTYRRRVARAAAIEAVGNALEGFAALHDQPMTAPIPSKWEAARAYLTTDGRMAV